MNRSVSAVAPRRPSDDDHRDSTEILQAAFDRSLKVIKWRWRVKITRQSPAATVNVRYVQTVRVEMTADDAVMLARLLEGATLVPGLGPPWMSTGEVARQLHVAQSTIRSWLANGSPKDHPFPQPDERGRGRTFWLKATIDAWQEEHDAIYPRHRPDGGN
jgi:predicted DNA-binding transcriptional regulator AlpA